MRKLALVVALTASSGFAADHFDLHTLDVLKTVAGSKVSKKANAATFADLAAQPKAIEGSASSLLVVKTDEGNWCKLLVRPSGWKLKGKPAPMLLIDRLVTYSADPRRGVKADRKDVFLFDGFGIDLDSGQIVPKGSGEDLVFKAAQPLAAAAGDGMAAMPGDKPAGPLKGDVAATKGVEMYLVAAPLVPPAGEAGGARVRKGPVAPGDFAGVFKLDADGRWTGPLRLRIDAEGKLSGDFTSDQTGNVYEASGEIGPAPNHFSLKITFPRTALELDGYLWTRERMRLAGSAKMEDRAFGFTALRSQ